MCAKLLLGIVISAAGLGLAGCNKALFPADSPRSQYQRYSQLRGQETPMTELDAAGIERPALRERLRPLD